MADFFGTEVPTLGPNLAACILFGILSPYHFIAGCYYRQWWFMTTWFIGLTLEFIGYIARVNGHAHSESQWSFLCQISALTFAPAFLMAGIYYQLGLLIHLYGRHFSLLGRKMTSYFFILIDFVSFMVQSGGGGMVGSAIERNDLDRANHGRYVTFSGLIILILGMIGFLTVMLYFYYKMFSLGQYNVWVTEREEDRNPLVARKARLASEGYQQMSYPPPPPKFEIVETPKMGRSVRFGKWFPMALLAATLLILMRTFYRAWETSQGWNSSVTHREVYFLTLELLPVFLATLCLTIWHPGYTFGHGSILRRFKVPMRT